MLEKDGKGVESGSAPPEPLVLHVNAGDCILISLTNRTTQGPVSIHANMLA